MSEAEEKTCNSPEGTRAESEIERLKAEMEERLMAQEIKFQAQLIGQEHRWAVVVQNLFIEMRKWSKGDPRRRKAIVAFLLMFMAPSTTVVAVGGGGAIVAWLTLLEFRRQNVAFGKQNEAFEEQNRRILEQNELQRKQFEQNLEEDYRARKAALLKVLYTMSVDGESGYKSSRSHSVNGRALGEAVIAFVKLEKTRLERSGQEARVDLRGANLQYVVLDDANLHNVNLRRVDLGYANIQNADLSEANLRYASLLHADLSGAFLRSANLRDSDLRNANLRHAKLWDADFSGAKNLTVEQIEEAYWDKNTKWPDSFEPPTKERLRPEEEPEPER